MQIQSHINPTLCSPSLTGEYRPICTTHCITTTHKEKLSYLWYPSKSHTLINFADAKLHASYSLLLIITPNTAAVTLRLYIKEEIGELLLRSGGGNTVLKTRSREDHFFLSECNNNCERTLCCAECV